MKAIYLSSQVEALRLQLEAGVARLEGYLLRAEERGDDEAAERLAERVDVLQAAIAALEDWE
jgi:hypothetical protein